MKKRGKDKDIVKKLRRFNGNTLTQMDFFGTYDDDEVVARAEDGSAKNVTPGGSGKKRKRWQKSRHLMSHPISKKL